MPNVRQLKRRIRSVENTAKITKAMSMIAASKMRRVQEAALRGRPYSDNLSSLLADLDAATRSQLERGQRGTEVLKQDQSVPLSMQQQVVILFALVNGHLDDVEIPRVAAFEQALRGFMESNHPDLLAKIADEKQLNDELEGTLTAAIEEFKTSVPY